MKSRLTPLLSGLSLLVANTLAAAEPDSPAAFQVDLDGDGTAETITWELFEKKGGSDEEFYQLRVLDQAGKPLWEGPRVADPENPLVLSNGGFDFGLPEIAADIDGDGAIELVIHMPQSDVSPSYFSVLRWMGGRFVPARSGTLLHTAKLKDGEFPWSDGEEWQGDWISSFRSANRDGSIVVDIFEYIGGKTPRMGEAIVTGTPQGFTVKRWTTPLKAVADMPTPEPPEPADAGASTVYRARLSPFDHFNSAGKLLEQASEILRQDRANFHRGKGDAEDGAEAIFRSPQGRDAIGQRKIIPVGTSEQALQEAITKHTPLVEIEVTAQALRVRLVE